MFAVAPLFQKDMHSLPLAVYMSRLISNHNSKDTFQFIIFLILLIFFLISQQADEIYIMSGSNEIDGGNTYYIDEILVHKRYRKGEYAYDIAALRTKSTVENKTYAYIPNAQMYVADGMELEIMGWGARTGNKIIAGDEGVKRVEEERSETLLRRLRVMALSMETCRKKFGPSMSVPDGYFCSIPWTGEGACSVNNISLIINFQTLIGIFQYRKILEVLSL